MIFKERGTNREKILETIKKKYGEDSKIISHKNIKVKQCLGLIARRGIEYTGVYSPGSSKTAETGPVNNRRDHEEERKTSLAPEAPSEDPRFREEILSRLGSLEKDNRIILNNVRSPGGSSLPEGLRKLSLFLKENDFPEEFIQFVQKRFKEKYRFTDLEDEEKTRKEFRRFFRERLSPSSEASREAEIVVLVGSTGVGKTTTLAKLAAYRSGENQASFPRKVRLVTLDHFRIGAVRQLEIYGEIMKIPVSVVNSPEDLKKILALREKGERILVDTTGRAAGDQRSLEAMQKILSVFRENEASVHLVLSAVQKNRDIKNLIQGFSLFRYNSVILTKLDETAFLGNVLSEVCLGRIPVSFITDGQSVPNDIRRATFANLTEKMKNFDYLQ